MLEPRESDIPILFLVLVVLPLVSYILLGKWSEATKKRNRISLLAHLAAEEALKAEEMAVAGVIPAVSSSKGEQHECARCAAPAKTRCSKCKSVRYCSGNCQIIHWRQIHKKECYNLVTHKSSSFPLAVSVKQISHGTDLSYEHFNPQFFSHSLKQALKENAALDTVVHPSTGTHAFDTPDYTQIDNSQVSSLERISNKSTIETTQKRDNGSMYESSVYKATKYPSSCVESKEAFTRELPQLRNSDYSLLEEETLNSVNPSGIAVKSNQQGELTSTMFEGDNYQSQNGNAFVPTINCGPPSLSNASSNNERIDEFETGIITKHGNLIERENSLSEEAPRYKCSSEMTIKRSVQAKKIPCPLNTKCSKSSKTLTNLSCSELEKKGKIPDETKITGIRGDIASCGSNGSANIEIMKMMDFRKSANPAILTISGGCGDKCNKIKMLFPYEEFVKIFQGEVYGIFPRGLLNCGNSCYANAVLQCLTSTKPLVIYLLCRSHSNSCCAKNWCLMCELEQHVMILRENGAPLSPSRILCHLRSLNCQIGDGSQEDAHEFLRLLIASMQSICLEWLGGEKKVDPRLQETTFIQLTFGGRLQSKVKCLNCNHESERYENILDLTLEILGWIESLEDALTQFTSPEDLDGENMYRCARSADPIFIFRITIVYDSVGLFNDNQGRFERCTEYVQARKQLSIHEAPNILTIVLKRFQEGRYGKINKCITFPEMLDMIPFMTGTGDIPPLYMLYAVVVHLDTLNASFSGHYVSYVKDMQGNWFRIDDIEVQPVHISQVMSEGAYILFYMRSSPRPPLAHSGITKVYDTSKLCPIETQKSSKSGHVKCSNQFVTPEHSSETRPETNNHFIDTSNCISQVTRNYAEPSRKFSDATSSDWSIFTSSDEASFTTESTRDSFSTVDYGDSGNVDPISSIFDYSPKNSSNSVCYWKFSNSRPLTRFFPEKVHMLNSYMSNHSLERLHKPLLN